MSPIEVAATIFGLISVYLTIKENIWCWPTGIIMVVLYIFIFYEVKLYSDMGLQIFYVFIQFYGWYHWLYGGKKKDDLPVTKLKKKHIPIWIFVIIVATFAWGYLMNNYTDAALPYYDAFAVALSVVAQWFLTIKKLESWILWIIVDVISVGIYIVKGLNLTAILYVVFLILAINGLLEWQKSYRVQKA
jgi:nicotinamide mononucleotide transporter